MGGVTGPAVPGHRAVGARWLWLSVAALGFSLLHTVLDLFLVLPRPTSGALSWPQEGMIVSVALVYGWWGYSLVDATGGGTGGRASLGVLGALWAVANGTSVVFCPPPCAFPVGDLAHLGSLACGALSAYASFVGLRGRPVDWRPAAVAGLLALAGFASVGLSVQS